MDVNDSNTSSIEFGTLCETQMPQPRNIRQTEYFKFNIHGLHAVNCLACPCNKALTLTRYSNRYERGPSTSIPFSKY